MSRESSRSSVVPGRYDREVKALALAQIEQGRLPAHVAIDLGVHERTVQRWAKRFREVAIESDDPKLVNEHYRLALRSMELQHEALDQLEESGEPLYKYIVPLNVIAGTNADKIVVRARGPVSAPASGTFIQIVIGEPPLRRDVDAVIDHVLPGEGEERLEEK